MLDNVIQRYVCSHVCNKKGKASSQNLTYLYLLCLEPYFRLELNGSPWIRVLLGFFIGKHFLRQSFKVQIVNIHKNVHAVTLISFSIWKTSS